MVHIEIRARIDKKLVDRAVNQAIKLVKPPKNLKVFVIDNIKQCHFVAADLKGFSKKSYEKFCKTERTSMSVTANGHQHLVVFITPEDRYLRTNKTALVGTIIHELVHTKQRKKFIDEKIHAELLQTIKRWRPKFRKIKVKNKKRLEAVIESVLDEAAYALKDIYANYELVKLGHGDYILEDYSNLYKGYKVCPKPMEFGKLHAAAKKNSSIVSEVMNFQISLLAVVIPFFMWRAQKGQQLAKRIESCYRISIGRVTYEFDDLIDYVVNNYSWRASFRKEYFDIIMQKLYTLVT